MVMSRKERKDRMTLKNWILSASIMTLNASILVSTVCVPALAQEVDWRSQMLQSLSSKGMSSSQISQSDDFLRRFEQAGKDAKAPSWEDISSAPSIPIPVFRGNQTTFLSIDDRYMMGQTTSDIKTLTIKTKDDANNVYTWYKQNLPSSGWSIENPGRGIVSTGMVHTEITARRSNEVAKITVAGTGSQTRDPVTTVSLMYLKKSH